MAGGLPPGQLRLSALAVDPAHRGQGVGSRLLAAVLIWRAPAI
ncbi:MAG: GNAT family N-acetyltransferase [Anaerolineales bacterium]|nr:GNAT family N-acetyltransferase [Anaerolineales bacterium]